MIRPFVISNLAVLLFVAAASAQAVDETYIGVQAASFDLDIEDIEPTVEPSGIIGRFGGSMGDVLIFEGRVGAGLSDDTKGAGVDAVTVDLNYLVGGYGLLRANVSETLFPYLIGGATLVDVGATDTPAIDGTETSFSYGLGFDVRVSEGLGFGIEYMRYVDSDDYDLDALSIGVNARF